jgi:hypothetical protein
VETDVLKNNTKLFRKVEEQEVDQTGDIGISSVSCTTVRFLMLSCNLQWPIGAPFYLSQFGCHIVQIHMKWYLVATASCVLRLRMEETVYRYGR